MSNERTSVYPYLCADARTPAHRQFAPSCRALVGTGPPLVQKRHQTIRQIGVRLKGSAELAPNQLFSTRYGPTAAFAVSASSSGRTPALEARSPRITTDTDYHPARASMGPPQSSSRPCLWPSGPRAVSGARPSEHDAHLVDNFLSEKGLRPRGAGIVPGVMIRVCRPVVLAMKALTCVLTMGHFAADKAWRVLNQSGNRSGAFRNPRLLRRESTQRLAQASGSRRRRMMRRSRTTSMPHLQRAWPPTANLATRQHLCE